MHYTPVEADALWAWRSSCQSHQHESFASPPCLTQDSRGFSYFHSGLERDKCGSDLYITTAVTLDNKDAVVPEAFGEK